MKALSVQQPWASLIALGIKTIEVRSWRTNFRGKLLICASGHDVEVDDLFFPAGYAVGIVDLVDIRPLTKRDLRKAHIGELPEEPQLAWVLKNAFEITPFPVKGKLQIFEVNIDPRPLPSPFESHIDFIVQELRNAEAL
jgi:hypothetical protein